MNVKFPLHPALVAGLNSWFPSFHSTVTTRSQDTTQHAVANLSYFLWEYVLWTFFSLHASVFLLGKHNGRTVIWQAVGNPFACTPLVLDLFPISAWYHNDSCFCYPNCYGVMPFIINFQHRIPSKKLKKSNMLTKLPWRQSRSWRSCCCIWTHHLKEGTCVQTATQWDKQNWFKVVEHFVEHGRRLEAAKP
jgi:hypothetical protein